MADLALDSSIQNRYYDADGQLHIRRTPISKATVNPYYGREIPDSEALGLSPEKIYQLLRDPSELAKAAPSFAGKQLMCKHTQVHADDPKKESIAGAVGSAVEYEHPYLMADLAVWDAEAIAGIETDAVRELSCSYRYRADMTPGMYEGKPYDGVMRDIDANHVALVEEGRAGHDVMAADAALETKMETKFGKLVYAMLSAISPKLAADAGLKPLVIGLTPKKLDLKALEPKLLAMDSALAKDATLAAMQNAKDAAAEEETEEEKKERERKEKEAKDKKTAKDGKKRAKDMDFEEWAKEEENEPEHETKEAKDARLAARDAEEDEEDKAKRKEHEKKAEDARKAMDGGFDDLVEKLEKKGYSKEYATKVAGKVAAEKCGDCSFGSMDKRAKDEKEAEDRKAMDEKIKFATDSLRAEFKQIEEAKRLVRPLVGDVLAMDSAKDILEFALDQHGIEHAGANLEGLKALVNQRLAAEKPASRLAFDGAGIEEKFPGASRSLNVM